MTSRRSGACAALMTFILLATIVGMGTETVSAGTRRGASKAKASAKKKSPAKSSARKFVSSRSGRSRAPSRARGTVARSRGGRGRQVVSRGGRGRQVSRRSLARSRARALQLARLRVVRARDAGLRNIAATNILNDNAAGEDPEIRRIAVDALAGRSGTIVVMNPNTGRVYSIVNQRMALGSPVKPCSTVKLIVGLGALHEGVFDPNQDVQLARNGWSLNLTDALAKSNNPFFQVLGRRLGFDRVLNYATNYGFGERTGVNHDGESPGFLPEEGEGETGHMSSHGDNFGVTAIQLAAFTGAIANGGNLYVPRVPRTREEATNFQPELRRRIEMSSEDRLRIMAGMIGAVNFGTAKLAADPIGQVAGKTGTCTGETAKLGLFTSFSSVDNPQLVVTVITTGSTEAGKRAAEIAGRVYRAISANFLRHPVISPASAAIEVSDK
jgi:penicillin-binding protein 2